MLLIVLIFTSLIEFVIDLQNQIMGLKLVLFGLLRLRIGIFVQLLRLKLILNYIIIFYFVK